MTCNHWIEILEHQIELQYQIILFIQWLPIALMVMVFCDTSNIAKVLPSLNVSVQILYFEIPVHFRKL